MSYGAMFRRHVPVITSSHGQPARTSPIPALPACRPESRHPSNTCRGAPRRLRRPSARRPPPTRLGCRLHAPHAEGRHLTASRAPVLPAARRTLTCPNAASSCSSSPDRAAAVASASARAAPACAAASSSRALARTRASSSADARARASASVACRRAARHRRVSSLLYAGCPVHGVVTAHRKAGWVAPRLPSRSRTEVRAAAHRPQPACRMWLSQSP